MATQTALPEAGKAVFATGRADGAVWVGAGITLESYGTGGQWVASITLPGVVRSMAFSPDGALLWVSTGTSASSYDATTGTLVSQLELPRDPSVVGMAVDPSSGHVWLALETEVRRYQPDGKLTAWVTKPSLGAITVDGHGGAWIAIETQLERLDSNLATTLSVNPWLGAQERILFLEPAPFADAILVGGATLTLEVGYDGTTLTQLFTYPPFAATSWATLQAATS